MTTPREALLGLSGLALAGAEYATGAFREARRQAGTRLFAQADVIETRAGRSNTPSLGKGRR